MAAQIFREGSSSVMPPVIAGRTQVVIDAADWDRAAEIERAWIESSARR